MNTTHQSFRENGYAVFPSALSDAELSMLRQSCQTLLDEPIDDGGHSGKHKIGLGSARRFLAHRHEEFPELEAFLLGNTIAKINETCLGDSGTLFNEQFVDKGSGTGASFAWHQDGAYVGFDHKAYLTVWIALDDTCAKHGTWLITCTLQSSVIRKRSNICECPEQCLTISLWGRARLRRDAKLGQP